MSKPRRVETYWARGGTEEDPKKVFIAYYVNNPTVEAEGSSPEEACARLVELRIKGTWNKGSRGEKPIFPDPELMKILDAREKWR